MGAIGAIFGLMLAVAFALLMMTAVFDLQATGSALSSGSVGAFYDRVPSIVILVTVAGIGVGLFYMIGRYILGSFD